MNHELFKVLEIATREAFEELDSEVIYQAFFGPSHEEVMKEAA